MSCPFCDLKRLRARVLEERSKTLVFFSDPRLMPGHLLVTPKRHVEHLADLASEERQELFDAAIEFQARIIARIAEGCDLSQHDRPFLPESRLKVDHVHVHLRPRNLADEFHHATKASNALFQPLADEEWERIVSLLR